MPPVLYHLLLAVAARMVGDHLGSGIQPHPERIGFQGQALVGVAHWNRVVIVLEAHAAGGAHYHLTHRPNVQGRFRQWSHL
jgi:hypothetical protein